MISDATCRQWFTEAFGTEPRLLSVAPGRVNLLGEHVDYLGGRVLPAAIDRGVSVAAALGHGPVLEVVAHDFDDRVAWGEAVLSGTAPEGWKRYLWGVLRELAALGLPWTGGQLLIAGDVPPGAGLSSSAALEVALLNAVLAAHGRELPDADLARLARKVENDQVGTACGVMDQFASVHGRAGHAMDLDCGTLEYRLFEPSLAGCRWLLIDSMVTHDLGDQYNRIRAELETAQRVLGGGPLLQHPEEAVLDAGDRLTTSELSRALYVAGEAGDVDEVGRLLRATHDGLRRLLRVSTPELDTIVEAGADAPGWLGGRMIGGGFGGCVLGLLREGGVRPFQEHVRRLFRQRFGLDCRFYPVNLADGARVVRL